MNASTPSKGRQKILLIDDDELIADSLRQYLSVQGCDVDVALEEAEANTLMGLQQYGVVVVDPFLTGGVHLEGSALLDSISLLQPDASVIIVTGYGSNDLTQLASAAKISLLTKPQSVVALSEFIFKGLSI
jgi:two-component system response regulator AtoC